LAGVATGKDIGFHVGAAVNQSLPSSGGWQFSAGYASDEIHVHGQHGGDVLDKEEISA
jgi:hypothetical protein